MQYVRVSLVLTAVREYLACLAPRCLLLIQQSHRFSKVQLHSFWFVIVILGPSGQKWSSRWRWSTRTSCEWHHFSRLDSILCGVSVWRLVLLPNRVYQELTDIKVSVAQRYIGTHTHAHTYTCHLIMTPAAHPQCWSYQLNDPPTTRASLGIQALLDWWALQENKWVWNKFKQTYCCNKLSRQVTKSSCAHRTVTCLPGGARWTGRGGAQRTKRRTGESRDIDADHLLYSTSCPG